MNNPCPRPTATIPAGDMVLVPTDKFQMGCDPDHDGGYACGSQDLPLQTVYLDAYNIDSTSVTNPEYAECVAARAAARRLSGVP